MQRSSAFVLAVAFALFSKDASAFCRTMTKGLQPGCTIGGAECCAKPEGVPVFWRNGCVGYNLHEVPSRYISYNDSAEIITQAFNRWTAATCTPVSDGDGRSRVSIDVRDLGPVKCGTVSYDRFGGPNQHVIAYRDDIWNKNDPDNTLALTTVQFDSVSGEIYDADMEVNTLLIGKQLAVKDEPQAQEYDFLSVITHEVGHFLGMAHSNDRNATMYKAYDPGAFAMRDLTQDDVQGLCSAYPPNGTRITGQDEPLAEEVCDPTPRGGFTTECADQKKACATSAGPAQGSSSWSLGALALAVALSFRRARRA